MRDDTIIRVLEGCLAEAKAELTKCEALEMEEFSQRRRTTPWEIVERLREEVKGLERALARRMNARHRVA